MHARLHGWSGLSAKSSRVESQCLARWHADLLDARARRDRRRRRVVVFRYARGAVWCGAKVVQNAAGELCITVSSRDRQDATEPPWPFSGEARRWGGSNEGMPPAWKEEVDRLGPI